MNLAPIRNADLSYRSFVVHRRVCRNGARFDSLGDRVNSDLRPEFDTDENHVRISRASQGGATISHEITSAEIPSRPVIRRYPRFPRNQSVGTYGRTKSGFRIYLFVISSGSAVVDRYVIITVSGSLPRSLRSR